jgi:hypothetical protein
MPSDVLRLGDTRTLVPVWLIDTWIHNRGLLGVLDIIDTRPWAKAAHAIIVSIVGSGRQTAERSLPPTIEQWFVDELNLQRSFSTPVLCSTAAFPKPPIYNGNDNTLDPSVVGMQRVTNLSANDVLDSSYDVQLASRWGNDEKAAPAQAFQFFSQLRDLANANTSACHVVVVIFDTTKTTALHNAILAGGGTQMLNLPAHTTMIATALGFPSRPPNPNCVSNNKNRKPKSKPQPPSHQWSSAWIDDPKNPPRHRPGVHHDPTTAPTHARRPGQQTRHTHLHCQHQRQRDPRHDNAIGSSHAGSADCSNRATTTNTQPRHSNMACRQQPTARARPRVPRHCQQRHRPGTRRKQNVRRAARRLGHWRLLRERATTRVRHDTLCPTAPRQRLHVCRHCPRHR